MAIDQISTQDFSGAIGTLSAKKDLINTARFIKNCNPFEDPAYLTLAKKTTKVSGSTVVNLPLWAQDASPWNTNRYFYDFGGNIYRETNAAVWSNLRTVSGSLGEGFLVSNNFLYYALTANIGRYGPLDNSPAFDDAFVSWWLAANIQTSGGGIGATVYTVQAAISEAVTHRQTFIPDHDPITSVVVDITTVGTGNWTCTVHDTKNRLLGAITVANASVAVNDFTFTFTTPIRVQPLKSYHFHITSSVADGTIKTDVPTDHEGAEFVINFAPLISATFHPMSELTGGWIIGNERYLGFFDNVNGEYDPTRLKLPAGFQVRTITKQEEYAVIECWRGQSFEEAEEGRRYFWDGIEQSYNYFEELPMGGPNAISMYRNQLIGVYGNRGSIYTGSKPFEKVVDEVPKLARGKKVEVYPGAITEYEERLLIGYSGVTDDSTGLEQGVYEYGSQAEQLPKALNYPYVISTDTTKSTTLKIGLVKSFGTDLYIGWRDGASYGVDKVALGDTAAATGAWESRIFDAGDQEKDKQAIKIEITFEALTTGQTVTPKYDINRTGTFTTGTAASTVGDTFVDLFIHKMYKEIEFGLNIASSSNTFPKITGINFIYDDLKEEDKDA